MLCEMIYTPSSSYCSFSTSVHLCVWKMWMNWGKSPSRDVLKKIPLCDNSLLNSLWAHPLMQQKLNNWLCREWEKTSKCSPLGWLFFPLNGTINKIAGHWVVNSVVICEGSHIRRKRDYLIHHNWLTIYWLCCV